MRIDDDSDGMQLDDSKYKVYIRNLDDELSSESEAEDGKLIFLPDIEKHLRTNRIPPSVLARPDPDILSKQLVLYGVPSSISVPEEHDSVRKAIIEARQRAREKQKAEAEGQLPHPQPVPVSQGVLPLPGAVMPGVNGFENGFPQGPPTSMPMQVVDDPDAMELD